MNVEFSGIERRLDELSERLARLAPLRMAELLAPFVELAADTTVHRAGATTHPESFEV